MPSKILIKINDIVKGKSPLTSNRHKDWPKIRQQHLYMYPYCAVCHGTSKLEVHHIIPFHIDPSKELDLNNLITLCEDASGGILCHLAIGHLGTYRSFNENVKEDAELLYQKLKNRP